MMKRCRTLFFGGLLCSAVVFAQNDSINRLEKVILVADSYVRNNVVGQKTTLLTSEQMVKNATNLTEIIRFNTPVSVRDYGNGGASSARFRGTSAENTAVMWNGININAFGNGQTGLNSLSLSTADEIVVKSGGGSVKYGSGAIGGSIHANDNLYFKKHQNLHLFGSYGSFNTTSNFLKTSFGSKQWAVKLGASVNKSTNDYELIDTRYKDEKGDFLTNNNGNYQNYGLSLSLGYQFSDGNTLSFYTTGYKGDRLFSGNLTQPETNDKYIDVNQRNLWVWKVQKNRFSHVLKTAYLTQEYRYFVDKNNFDYDFGKSKRWLFNYDFTYFFNQNSSLNTFLDFQNIEGKTNQISPKTREQYAFAIGFQSFFMEQWEYNIELKKEFNSAFHVPPVFVVGTNYTLKDAHEILLNISSNYRVPTLNELYWPNNQGNLDLIPEKSNQVDLGYQYKNNWLTLKTTIFFMDVMDKIIWTPQMNSTSWKPINLEESTHTGVEFYSNFYYSISNHQFIEATTNYTYTMAKDVDTHKDLIFVPRHLFNSIVNYQNGNLTAYVQNLSQSKVFTTEDNLNHTANILQGFTVFNLGMGVLFFQDQAKSLHVELSIKNMFNELYSFSVLRPMPGTNFNININYKL